MYGIFYKEEMLKVCFLVFSTFFLKTIAGSKKNRIFAPQLRNQ